MNAIRKILCLLLILSAAPSGALEIPLGGTAETTSGASGTTVGYVDMDQIFRIYPQTAIAKEDYGKQLQRKRDQLREKETQVNNLKSRLGVLESTIKDMPAEDTATVGGQNTSDMKQQLETQMTELEDMRKQAERDLAAFQAQQSQMILGKIYQALRDLAQEEQVTLVVDKASILYGDAAVDLTEKLQTRVRGY